MQDEEQESERIAARRKVPGAGFASVIALAYGVVMLTFLVAVDHGEWFHIEPASGIGRVLASARD